MKSVFKRLPLLAVAAMSLGLAIPAFAQDAQVLSVECGADGYSGNLKAIEAVDPYTFKFTFCNPDPALTAKVAFSAMAIHSADQIEATGGAGDILEQPIGTGPYKLERWDKGEQVVFSVNENYWGDAPIESTAVLKWNAEAAARWNELQAGTVDGIDNPGPGDFVAIEGNADYKLYPRLSSNVFYLGVNNTFAPFDNIKVRQALAIGIDKQRIVDNFYPPGSSVATQFMPPSIFGFTADSVTPEYDLEAAKALMAESGVTLPITVDLSYRDVVRGYLPQPGVVATDLQAQLKELGIEVNITVMESGAFLDAASAGELPLFLLGWGADYPDATNFLDYHFGAGSNDSFGDKDSVLTDLLAQAAQLSDPAERLAIYTEANNEIANFVPMIPIAHGGNATAFKASIAGAYSGSFGAEQFRVMENPDSEQIVFQQNGEPISLFCNDESDGETFRACEQINESLLGYELGGGNVVPALATEWSANEDLTEWTFTLREGVKFSDGSDFDSSDVFATYAMMWDAANPSHVGRTGSFDYFSVFFGGFINAPAS
ncbi:MAG: ABC transporter substrate-binding protein [Chloroflexi bacterium]|nr:ABC transporter substrate-binding protein [Chloroflexota bacterium]MCC6892152.1 peptide ABC transporter substrate-binding protein [Anaerolineae bacterium]